MRKVRAECEVDAAAEEVIAAFLEPEALRAWWNVERALIEPEVGGIYALAWGITDRGFQYVTTGIVEALDRSGHLRIGRYTYFHPQRGIFGPMTLTVEALCRNGGLTAMCITQDGYRQGADWDWYYAAVDQAWPQVAKGIAQYVGSAS